LLCKPGAAHSDQSPTLTQLSSTGHAPCSSHRNVIKVTQADAVFLVVLALTTQPALRVRYYEADDSVFLDDEYLIKGGSGRLLWLLLGMLAAHGRTTFSNRELRLHPLLKLPGCTHCAWRIRTRTAEPNSQSD
jgi:hypothetical protein